jgi:prepilin-type N-terminal cleavage/methylation domain-containing protein
MKRFSHKRKGFTLVELMVVMGIIALLTAMVMLVAPNILDKDRARDAATQLQGVLANARMRAMRDGVPRGVRLILDPPLASQAGLFPTVTTPPPASQTEFTFITASSYQYIEVPPWLVFTNQSGATAASNPVISVPNSPWLVFASQSNSLAPFLQFQYVDSTQPFTLTNTPPQVPVPQKNVTVMSPAGAIQNRICTIGGLTMGQMQQLIAIVNGTNGVVPPASTPPTLGVPTISFWSTIIPGSLQPNPTPNPPPNPMVFSCTIQLSIYPDGLLGGSNVWQVNTPYSNPASGTTTPAYFGIYQSPRPLLGEPIMQMPVNTTVDLSDGVSQPSFQSIGGFQNPSTQSLALPGYDILFSPSGQMMAPFGFSQLFLWVRDATKGPQNMAGAMLSNNLDQGSFFSISPFAFNNTGLFTNAQYQAAFPKSGEQLLVTVKGNSGGTGVSPVFWPTAANANPYYNALSQATSP